MHLLKDRLKNCPSFNQESKPSCSSRKPNSMDSRESSKSSCSYRDYRDSRESSKSSCSYQDYRDQPGMFNYKDSSEPSCSYQHQPENLDYDSDFEDLPSYIDLTSSWSPAVKQVRSKVYVVCSTSGSVYI